MTEKWREVDENTILVNPRTRLVPSLDEYKRGVWDPTVVCVKWRPPDRDEWYEVKRDREGEHIYIDGRELRVHTEEEQKISGAYAWSLKNDVYLRCDDRSDREAQLRAVKELRIKGSELERRMRSQESGMDQLDPRVLNALVFYKKGHMIPLSWREGPGHTLVIYHAWGAGYTKLRHGGASLIEGMRFEYNEWGISYYGVGELIGSEHKALVLW